MPDARSRSKCPRVPWALCAAFGAIRESVPALHCSHVELSAEQRPKCRRRHCGRGTVRQVFGKRIWANQISQRGCDEPSCKAWGWMQHLWHTQPHLVALLFGENISQPIPRDVVFTGWKNMASNPGCQGQFLLLCIICNTWTLQLQPHYANHCWKYCETSTPNPKILLSVTYLWLC